MLNRRLLVSSLAALLLNACAMGPFAPGPEPGVIAVRNLSGVDIQRVTLSNDSPDGGPYARQGSISPVPAGVTQVVGRGTNAPRLARRVELRWTAFSGTEHTAEVDLRPVLRNARGGRDEALVFELQPQGRIRARVELKAAGT